MNAAAASTATAVPAVHEAPAHESADGDKAAQDAARTAKRRSHHINNLRLVAISYAMDGVGLLLFFFAGTIGWMPAVLYTAAGLISSGVMGWMVISGWSARFKDPGLSVAKTITAQSIQLIAMYLLPEVGFMFALILFIVYVSLTMTLPVKKSFMAWAALSVVMGMVLMAGSQGLRVPDATPFEQGIAVSFFLLTLWRCIWLGNYNSGMMQLLNKRNKELASLTAQVDQLARHDELTGLLNRRSLLALLDEELQRAARYGAPLSVALIDIDHFKRVNDTLGHLAGDKVLKVFADTLLRHTRGTDRFGRYGGEEFLLIVTGTAAETALVPMERMRDALSSTDMGAIAPGLAVTFSSGIASYRAGEESEMLLQRADQALYRAKSDGRNCTRLG